MPARLNRPRGGMAGVFHRAPVVSFPRPSTCTFRRAISAAIDPAGAAKTPAPPAPPADQPRCALRGRVLCCAVLCCPAGQGLSRKDIFNPGPLAMAKQSLRGRIHRSGPARPSPTAHGQSIFSLGSPLRSIPAHSGPLQPARKACRTAEGASPAEPKSVCRNRPPRSSTGAGREASNSSHVPLPPGELTLDLGRPDIPTNFLAARACDPAPARLLALVLPEGSRGWERGIDLLAPAAVGGGLPSKSEAETRMLCSRRCRGSQHKARRPPLAFPSSHHRIVLFSSFLLSQPASARPHKTLDPAPAFRTLFTAPRFASLRLASSRFVSSHLDSSHVGSSRLVSSLLISTHL
ncbi:hypothetical protein JHW43_009241 [Diplocarpon mali]|nr:hypothetical protein JHW43_009241 [Diplocarpon mali]